MMLDKIKEKLFLMQQKSALLTEKKKLQKELKRLGRFPSYGDSDDDNAQEVEDFTGNLSVEKQLRKLLKEVDKALKKIAQGQYGYCENCQEMIEQARLKAFPAATTCIKCLPKK